MFLVCLSRQYLGDHPEGYHEGIVENTIFDFCELALQALMIARLLPMLTLNAVSQIFYMQIFQTFLMHEGR
jgi:hypothetical protein